MEQIWIAYKQRSSSDLTVPAQHFGSLPERLDRLAVEFGFTDWILADNPPQDPLRRERKLSVAVQKDGHEHQAHIAYIPGPGSIFNGMVLENVLRKKLEEAK